MIGFEWDENKAKDNWDKHDVRFEKATEVFDDPFVVQKPNSVVNGEVRWQATGMTNDNDHLYYWLFIQCVKETDRKSSESLVPDT